MESISSAWKGKLWLLPSLSLMVMSEDAGPPRHISEAANSAIGTTGLATDIS